MGQSNFKPPPGFEGVQAVVQVEGIGDVELQITFTS
jgi:hypothetical protein